jgi:hypothetical protein
MRRVFSIKDFASVAPPLRRYKACLVEPSEGLQRTVFRYCIRSNEAAVGKRWHSVCIILDDPCFGIGCDDMSQYTNRPGIRVLKRLIHCYSNKIYNYISAEWRN